MSEVLNSTEEIEEGRIDPDKTEINKMTDWANEPTIADLKKNIDDGEIDQEAHKSNVATWLLNRAAERKEVKGQSNVQPKLIRKQAEWRYSSLEDPFLSTPDLFNVYPTTAGDVKRARQNGMVLNKQFNTQINKVAFIGDFVRDAVDIGTVICKVGWLTAEEEVTNMVPEYQYLPDENGTLGEFYIQLLKLRVEDPEAYADHETPGIDHALDIFMQTGQAMFAKEVGETEVTKTIETKNQPTLEVTPSGNVIVDPSCGGDLDKAVFVGEKYKTSLAELTRDGKYKNLDKINIGALASPPQTENFTDGKDINSFRFDDKARKQFVVYTYWGEWDIHGDGTTQQIVASWVGDVCIRKELNPFPDRRPPFTIAVYMPVRDSVYGEPDGALLKENQDIIGAVTRGAIDLLGKSANSQTGMRKDMLDATNLRKFKAGEDYQFNQGVDPKQGVHTHVYPEIPRSVFDMLGIQNNEAESLTGVKNYGGDGLSSGSLGDVASNAGRVLDAAALREIGILRRLSQGILDIGRKMIAMNAEFLSAKEVVRVTDDKFIEVRRDDMAGNFDLRLTISTAEEDNAKAQELAFMLQTGASSMDFEFIKMLLSDIARLRKMPALAEKIDKYQPQPNPVAQEAAQLANDLIKAQIRKEDALAAKHNAEAVAAGQRGYKDETQGGLNTAKSGEEQAKGRKHGSEADKIDQDYLNDADGTTHSREVDKQDRKDGNKMITDLAVNKQKENQSAK